MTQKTIRRKIVEKAIRRLLNAEKSAKLTDADFDSIGDKPITIGKGKYTKFIKDKTLLYRESWILNPLREAIEILQGELNGERDYNRDSEW